MQDVVIEVLFTCDHYYLYCSILNMPRKCPRSYVTRARGTTNMQDAVIEVLFTCDHYIRTVPF